MAKMCFRAPLWPAHNHLSRTIEELNYAVLEIENIASWQEKFLVE